MTWYQKICEKAFNKILEVPCKKRARKIIFPFNTPYSFQLWIAKKWRLLGGQRRKITMIKITQPRPIPVMSAEAESQCNGFRCLSILWTFRKLPEIPPITSNGAGISKVIFFFLIHQKKATEKKKMARFFCVITESHDCCHFPACFDPIYELCIDTCQKMDCGSNSAKKTGWAVCPASLSLPDCGSDSLSPMGKLPLECYPDIPEILPGLALMPRNGFFQRSPLVIITLLFFVFW